MQQQLDLLLFFFSYTLLIYWCVLVFKYKGEKTLLLRLSKKQVIALVIAEVILFIGMYLNYKTHKSVDIADSFAWHYSIVYARGVLPLIGLASLDDNIFDYKDPVLSCLVVGLIVDYIILLICTKIASITEK